MAFIRRHRIFGFRLALFALALQFALSFAHIHAEDFVGPAQATAAPMASGDTDEHGAPDHDHCDICATMQMLAGSALPSPPVVIVALVSHIIERLPPAIELGPVAATASFRARAPPRA